MKRRVVVTGMGVVTSLSCQVDDLFKRLLAGESGIHPLRLFDVSDFKVQIGGDVYDWDPHPYSPPRKSSGSTGSRNSRSWRAPTPCANPVSTFPARTRIARA
jgi:3-oxoacyl-(acyl-carrier-protein) synthase